MRTSSSEARSLRASQTAAHSGAGPGLLKRPGTCRRCSSITLAARLSELLGQIRLELSPDIGRPFYRAITSLVALALIETSSGQDGRGGRFEYFAKVETAGRTGAKYRAAAGHAPSVPPRSSRPPLGPTTGRSSPASSKDR